MAGLLESEIAGRLDIAGAFMLENAAAKGGGDFARAVLTVHVHDHDLSGPAETFEAGRQLGLFVERVHHCGYSCHTTYRGFRGSMGRIKPNRPRQQGRFKPPTTAGCKFLKLILAPLTAVN